MSDTDNFECVYFTHNYLSENPIPHCFYHRRPGCLSDCAHYGDCDYCQYQLGEEYCASCEFNIDN